MTADSEELVGDPARFRALASVRTGPSAPPSDENSLAEMLLAIIAAGRCNYIVAPARMPDDPSLLSEFAALHAASADFEVLPGLPLSDIFWTHHSHLRNGDVTARLRVLSRQATIAAPGRMISGFIATYATHVHSPLLYGPKRLPLRVKESVTTVGATSGPFLALVQCRLTTGGIAEAQRAFAHPIYDARRFVPVASELERNVLRALEALQVALDAHGVECEVERCIGGGEITQAPRIKLTAGREGREPQRLAIAVASTEHDIAAVDADFVVTPTRFADGVSRDNHGEKARQSR